MPIPCMFEWYKQVGRFRVESMPVRTVSPHAYSYAEVIVLASACHDSVTVNLCAQVCLVAIVSHTTATILLANWGELYKIYSTVAWDLWQCKETLSSGYALRLGLSIAINSWACALTTFIT